MKVHAKKILAMILGAAMACSILLTGCGGGDAPAGEDTSGSGGSSSAEGSDGTASVDKIKVALVAPMTGDSAQYGQQFQRGVEVFIEEYNAKGGFNGALIELTVFDDKNDAKEAVNIGNKIISEGDYTAVIGPFSSTCAFALGEVLDEEKILTVSPSCSHADYVTQFDYTFRLAHVNTDEGVFVAKYCAQEWGSEKIAGIYSNNDWGLSLNEAFVEEVANQGMELVGDEAFIIGQTKDFSPIITKIKDAGADTVYLMGQYAEVGQMLIQLRELAPDMKVFVTSSAYKVETLDIAGDAAVGAEWCTAMLIDSPEPQIQEFRQKILDTYGVDIDNMVTRAYDAMKIVFDAVDSCQKLDPDSIKAEILKIGHFDGVSGSFDVMEERNVTRQFYVVGTDGEGNFTYIAKPELA